MKCVIYKCDGCRKILSDQTNKVQEPHICIENTSILLARPSKGGEWDRKNMLEKRGTFQFCNAKCFENWLLRFEVAGI